MDVRTAKSNDVRQRRVSRVKGAAQSRDHKLKVVHYLANAKILLILD